MNKPALPIHRHRQEHMATFFELRLAHENAAYARQAAQAAFQITARLEKRLSRHRQDSEITQIRFLSANEPLRLSADTFHCLRLAVRIQQITGGAFDPVLGAEMDVWRAGRQPGNELRRQDRGRLLMDPENLTVRATGGPVALDLGAIGKGFALDRMAEELQAWDITRSLLVAGGSSILALDAPEPGSAGWEVSLTATKKLFLRQSAIGASGTSVKGAHILDPRTGQPAPGPYRAWALHSSAAIADALSTAWMLLGPDEIERVCRELPGARAFLQRSEKETGDLAGFGPYAGPPPAAQPKSSHGHNL